MKGTEPCGPLLNYFVVSRATAKPPAQRPAGLGERYIGEVQGEGKGVKTDTLNEIENIY